MKKWAWVGWKGNLGEKTEKKKAQRWKNSRSSQRQVPGWHMTSEGFMVQGEVHYPVRPNTFFMWAAFPKGISVLKT